MASNRKKKASSNAVPGSRTPVDGDQRNQSQIAFFPYARYTSIVGVHTTLLGFSALFLPGSNLPFGLSTKLSWEQKPLTSQDRPQHPFLVPLTANPVMTLTYICMAVTGLQFWWGGWLRGWTIELVMHGTSDEKKAKKLSMDGSKLKEIARTATMTVASSFAFYISFVLLGAPIASKILHTYLLALLTALLVILPPAYTLGPPSFGSDTSSLVKRLTWVRLFVERSIRTPIDRALVYPAIGTLLGGWVGIIPIALDWDRPWQAWPLTPAFGGIFGYILGSLAAVTVNGVLQLALLDAPVAPKST